MVGKRKAKRFRQIFDYLDTAGAGDLDLISLVRLLCAEQPNTSAHCSIHFIFRIEAATESRQVTAWHFEMSVNTRGTLDVRFSSVALSQYVPFATSTVWCVFSAGVWQGPVAGGHAGCGSAGGCGGCRPPAVKARCLQVRSAAGLLHHRASARQLIISDLMLLRSAAGCAESSSSSCFVALML